MTLQAFILLCTFMATVGLPLGYYLAWCWEQADQWFEQYIDGIARYYAVSPELWR